MCRGHFLHRLFLSFSSARVVALFLSTVGRVNSPFTALPPAHASSHDSSSGREKRPLHRHLPGTSGLYSPFILQDEKHPHLGIHNKNPIKVNKLPLTTGDVKGAQRYHLNSVNIVQTQRKQPDKPEPNKKAEPQLDAEKAEKSDKVRLTLKPQRA